MTHRAPVIGPGNGVLPRGQLYLTAPVTLDFTAADTYEKIPGTWAGASLHMFTADASGKLTYNGPDNTAVLFAGSSDCTGSKTADMSYALFKNGELVPNAETPFDVETPIRVRNISITAILMLNADDYLEVFAKTNDDTTDLNVSTLSITCWGDHKV